MASKIAFFLIKILRTGPLIMFSLLYTWIQNCPNICNIVWFLSFCASSRLIRFTNTNKLNELKCFICNKEFRNETTLGNHDKKFHLEKGASFFKCDNCDETFWEKMQLGQHITKDHTSCSLCKKVYPDSTSLNYHVTAVHNKLKMKHDIERESSLRIHKVKRFNSRV